MDLKIKQSINWLNGLMFQEVTTIAVPFFNDPFVLIKF